ncbi:MAG: hypothetical protein RLZZ399_2199 [Verrucomicrobiota bacterium]|jgi:hypothetical protein
MQLTQEQKNRVAGWISEGLTLAQIQDRLGTEFEIRMTYMEARMLVDDLKLLPKETAVPEPVKPAEPMVPPQEAGAESGEAPQPGAPAGSVQVKVDTLTRPGAMVSGSVTFSDGEVAQWYLDQTGRLGMVPPSPAYRPPQQDIPTFQMLLDNELSKVGF